LYCIDYSLYNSRVDVYFTCNSEFFLLQYEFSKNLLLIENNFNKDISDFKGPRTKKLIIYPTTLIAIYIVLITTCTIPSKLPHTKSHTTLFFKELSTDISVPFNYDTGATNHLVAQELLIIIK